MGVGPQVPSPSDKPGDDAIDPATLPSIESLGADSDYTVFLRKGVPEALRIAALRKAWASDPFIRDFRSPAIDYGWDFTTPEYSLRATDDVGKMLDQIFGSKPAAPAAGDPPPPAPAASLPPPPEPTPSLPLRPAAAQLPQELPLPQNEAVAAPCLAAEPAPAEEPKTARRKHGGALPDRSH